MTSPSSSATFGPLALKVLKYTVTIVAFLALNSSLNMMNRWVLGVHGFRFPIFLTMCHLASGFAILSVPMWAMRCFSALHCDTVLKEWRGISAVAVCKVSNIVLQNISLVYITLSLNQIIRSAIPVITALLGIFIEHKVPSGFEMLSLVILSTGAALIGLTWHQWLAWVAAAGVMLSVYEGSVGGSAQGITACLAGTFAGSAMLSWSGRVLASDMDVFRLTYYTAPVSLAVLLPFFLLEEAGSLGEYFRAGNASGGPVVAILLAGGLNALAYNCLHYYIIQQTSAVATPVIGMIKVVGVIMLSAAFLGERDLFSAKMVVGCTLAVLGFTLYGYAKLEGERRRKTVYVRARAGPDGGRPMSGPSPDVEAQALLPKAAVTGAGRR